MKIPFGGSILGKINFWRHGGDIVQGSDSFLESLREAFRGPNSLSKVLNLALDERNRILVELETYKHAFETTAADRDRLSVEVDTYRHAFETTSADRDRLAESAFSMADPLDAGFFRVNLRKLGDLSDENLGSLEQRWELFFDDHKYQELTNDILDKSGIYQALVLDDDYLQKLAAYWLACFFCNIRRFDKAQRYVDFFDYWAPIDATDMLPYDLGQGSRLARYRQLSAIEKGRPSAFIISLPKSASAFLSQAISEVFQVPILRASIGDAMRSMVIPRWIDQIAEGGAVTHNHFQALPVNIVALKKSRVKNIWILTRDPRDAVYSLREMEKSCADAFGNADRRRDDRSYMLEQRFINNCNYFSQWISDWVTVSRCSGLPFTVSLLTFDQITTDLQLVFSKMFPDHLDTEISSHTKVFLDHWETGLTKRRNFRSGKGQEWRAEHSDEFAEKLWAVIPENVRSALNLKR